METTRQVLRHEVAVVHATTGDPVGVRAAFAEPAPPGWALRTLTGRVVVTETVHGAGPGGPGGPPPGPVRLALTAADPAVAVRLAEPAAVVELTDPAVTHAFAPAPSVLEVALVGAGGPVPGRTVLARPSAGADVDLPEDPEQPGVYRSAPVAWTAAFHPFEIRVDGLLLRRAFIDVTRRTTRIRLVDTT